MVAFTTTQIMIAIGFGVYMTFSELVYNRALLIFLLQTGQLPPRWSVILMPIAGIIAVIGSIIRLFIPKKETDSE